MKNENIYLAAWEIAGNRVKLVFSDRDVVYISKADFDRAFGTIINAKKDEVIRDYAVSNGNEKKEGE